MSDLAFSEASGMLKKGKPHRYIPPFMDLPDSSQSHLEHRGFDR